MFTLGAQHNEIIGFEQNVDLKGLNYFGELFNAILHKKVLRLKYKSFKSNQISEHIIHPYYLKQYNSRWFLFGKTLEYEGITNLALDRIENEIVQVSQSYIENTEYNFDDYFEDIIGVTKPIGKEAEKVKLWFPPAQAPYIHTKPLHGTQKEKWDESGLTITIEVILNVELEHLILRYGSNCRVLEPEELKKKIKENLKNALLGY